MVNTNKIDVASFLVKKYPDMCDVPPSTASIIYVVPPSDVVLAGPHKLIWTQSFRAFSGVTLPL